MKKLAFTLLVLTLALGLFTPPTAGAALTSQPVGKTTPPPGVQIAQTLSVVTGVAISPLLGVSAVGAYQYFKATTDEQRARLPWFANPLFWVPALLLVVACALKDAGGVVALPTVMKKPLDVAETIEHKISGLVATGAFVPIMVNLIHEANSTGGQPSASLSSLGLATIDLHTVFYDVLMTPIAMAAFFIVFLASNAINILILISPFSTVDAALKTFRTAVLATVVGSAWMNPWVGAAWRSSSCSFPISSPVGRSGSPTLASCSSGTFAPAANSVSNRMRRGTIFSSPARPPKSRPALTAN